MNVEKVENSIFIHPTLAFSALIEKFLDFKYHIFARGCFACIIAIV